MDRFNDQMQLFYLQNFKQYIMYHFYKKIDKTLKLSNNIIIFTIIN